MEAACARLQRVIGLGDAICDAAFAVAALASALLQLGPLQLYETLRTGAPALPAQPAAVTQTVKGLLQAHDRVLSLGQTYSDFATWLTHPVTVADAGVRAPYVPLLAGRTIGRGGIASLQRTRWDSYVQRRLLTAVMDIAHMVGALRPAMENRTLSDDDHRLVMTHCGQMVVTALLHEFNRVGLRFAGGGLCSEAGDGLRFVGMLLFLAKLVVVLQLPVYWEQSDSVTLVRGADNSYVPMAEYALSDEDDPYAPFSISHLMSVCQQQMLRDNPATPAKVPDAIAQLLAGAGTRPDITPAAGISDALSVLLFAAMAVAQQPTLLCQAQYPNDFATAPVWCAYAVSSSLRHLPRDALGAGDPVAGMVAMLYASRAQQLAMPPPPALTQAALRLLGMTPGTAAATRTCALYHYPRHVGVRLSVSALAAVVYMLVHMHQRGSLLRTYGAQRVATERTRDNAIAAQFVREALHAIGAGRLHAWSDPLLGIALPTTEHEVQQLMRLMPLGADNAVQRASLPEAQRTLAYVDHLSDLATDGRSDDQLYALAVDGSRRMEDIALAVRVVYPTLLVIAAHHAGRPVVASHNSPVTAYTQEVAMLRATVAKASEHRRAPVVLATPYQYTVTANSTTAVEFDTLRAAALRGHKSRELPIATATPWGSMAPLGGAVQAAVAATSDDDLPPSTRPTGAATERSYTARVRGDTAGELVVSLSAPDELTLEQIFTVALLRALAHPLYLENTDADKTLLPAVVRLYVRGSTANIAAGHAIGMQVLAHVLSCGPQTNARAAIEWLSTSVGDATNERLLTTASLLALCAHCTLPMLWSLVSNAAGEAQQLYDARRHESIKTEADSAAATIPCDITKDWYDEWMLRRHDHLAGTSGDDAIAAETGCRQVLVRLVLAAARATAGAA